MASTGSDRRGVAQDNLAGSTSPMGGGFQLGAQNPLNVPGVRAANGPQNVSVTDGVFGKLAELGSKKIREAAAARANKKYLEGQMAYHQGKSFEDVAIGGDKFAMEGFRVMDAQTVSSTILQQQLDEIEYGGAELTPEEYRATWTARLDETLQGKDERTQDLIRELALQHLPSLSSKHMSAHMAHREQQNYTSLVNSVDTLSRGEENTNALLSFARGGPNSASAGLTDERRQAAVVEGIVTAFGRDNPDAYNVLEREGLLKNLTASQLNQVEAARSHWEGRQRATWDAEFEQQREAIIQEATINGTGYEATIRMQELYATRGWRLGSDEARAVVRGNREAVEGERRTRALEIEEARLSGDYGRQATLMTDAVQQHESANNPNAVSNKGATGLMQLMPGTARNPGIPGMGDIFQEARSMGVHVPDYSEATLQRLMRHPAVSRTFGTKYLEGLLRRYEGDVPRALAAYNWGMGNVDGWDGRLASLPKETRDYIGRITKTLGNEYNAEDDYERTLQIHEENQQSLQAERLFEYEMGARSVVEDFGVHGDRDRLRAELGVLRSDLEIGYTEAEAMREIRIIDAEAQQQMGEAAEMYRIDVEENTAFAQEQVKQIIAEGGPDVQERIASVMGDLEQRIGFSQQTHGIEVPPSAVRRQSNELATMAQGFREQALAVTEQRAELAMIGPNGNIPPELRERATLDFREEVKREAANLNAKLRRDGASEQDAGEQTAAFIAQRTNDFIARTGAVPEAQARVMTSALGGDWLIDGKLTAASMEAMGNFQQIYSQNPDAARRMVNGNQAIFERAKRVSDLFAATGNMQYAMESVARGAPMRDRTEQEQADAAAAVPGAVRDAVVDNFNTSVLDAIRADTTLGEALQSRNVTMFRQSWNPLSGLQLNMDHPANATIMSQVERHTETILNNVPGISPEEAARQATSTVMQRGALLGNSFVVPSNGEDSITRQMFGNNPANVMAPDRAIMDYLTSPEVQAEFPTVADAVGLAGDLPYSVYSREGQYYAIVEGPAFEEAYVPLDLPSIGDAYIRR